MPSSRYSISALADTNVLSELAKAPMNPGVLAWSRNHLKVGISPVSVE